jgi:O-antigen ligase
VLLAFVVVVSNNRNAAVAIPLVVLCAVVIDRRRARDTPSRSNRPRVVLIALALVVAAAGLVAMLESGARERLRVIGEPVGDGQSALLVLTERDTRPMIWAYYTKLAIRSPIVGVGFGRTVPGIHYHTQDDRDLARVEFNAYIHAHNLFLNWWLQTGVVGVALLVWVLASVTIEARRIARDGSIPLARTALVSLYALIALMVIRDATDDLLVFGMATLFWTLLGALGGVLRRTADATGRRVP